jgi:hypothetical protein
VSWEEHFAERIVLDDGTKLATLRKALAHLAKIITKAERNPPEVLTASDFMTKAAEQGGPVEFARSINRVRSLTQRPEMRTSQAGARPMTDREVVLQAIEETQRILAEYEYIERGRRGAVATVKVLLDVLNVLDRREVVAALNRLKQGFGLHVVK